MRPTLEQLQEFTDAELSEAVLAKLYPLNYSGKDRSFFFNDSSFYFSCGEAEYRFDINNWSDMGALANKHKISSIYIGKAEGFMAYTNANFETICLSPDGSDNGVSAFYSDKPVFNQNELRAKAIVFLLMEV